ncbi:hypothetical protein FHS85_001394 [Rhodoligotrophos appendicifer]|uniref:hypothetical protein n=1 Tax=Rhodoligotrophos appendicifer TaxID=987056 RepID=UPI001186161B|nr:hypothetical protein [Rhodoligotrophos appendicifer]
MTRTAASKPDYASMKARYEEEDVSVTLTKPGPYQTRRLKLDLDDEESETVHVPLDQDDLDQTVLGFDPYHDRFDLVGEAPAGGPSTPVVKVQGEYKSGQETYVFAVPEVLVGTGTTDVFGFPSSLIQVKLAPAAWQQLMEANDGDRVSALGALRPLLNAQTPGLAEWPDFPAIDPTIERPQHDAPQPAFSGALHMI